MSKALSSTLVDLFRDPGLGKHYFLQGWLRNSRKSAKIFFLILSDGTTQQTLQAVGQVEDFDADLLQKLDVGAAVALSGTLVETPNARQPYELHVAHIDLLGEAEAEHYPLQPKAHSYPFLRSIAHLRPRTATFGAVFRLRHAASYAIHHFFHKQGFFQVHTPVIAAADAEGAGEMFSLRTSEEPDTRTFFGKPSHLTVSGQLEAELLALALSKVYTFGPTFRAEHSNTTRHLSEFWMVEPEIAFFDLTACIKLAINMFQAVIKEILESCSEEIAFLGQQAKKQGLSSNKGTKGAESDTLLATLEQLSTQKVPVLSYTEAFELLKESPPNRKGKFAYPIRTWGQELQAEHEQYLVQHAKGAVVVRDYPSQRKAFYMRLNEDGKTVAAMDVLVPGVGELVGGSQREERLETLQKRMKACGVSQKELDWYLDTRRYGSVKHSGFGLGFDRLVQLLSGMENIRDVIPFPRSMGQLAH